MKGKQKPKNKGLFGIDTTFLTADIGKERKFLFENIALMLLGGLNITDVLESIEGELKSTKIKGMVRKMHDQIQNGDPIWKAFRDAGILSEHLLSVIKIGEESGRLAENLQIVVEQKERDAEFRAKLRSASLYPSFVVVLMIIIGLGIGIFILPRLAGIYQNLAVDLPLVTRIMISVGDFMGSYGYIVGPIVLLALSSIVYILFINKKTKTLGQSLILKTPVIKRLVQEIEISRLGYLLGTLLNAGIPLVDALNLVKDSSTYFVYQKMYGGWVIRIEQGYTLKESFEKVPETARFLPLYPKQAIITGEKTGTLGDALVKVGEIYIKKNENSTKDLSVVLEPLLLMVVWIGVAFIAFAVILPIYSLVGDITNVTQNQGIEEPAEPDPEAVEQFDNIVEENSNNQFLKRELIIVNQNFVPVYDTPNGIILTQVELGNIFPYTENSLDEWYEIELDNGILGWVSQDFIQEL